MDACIAVEREVDNVMSKIEELRGNSNDVLQQLIDNLEMINNLQTNYSNNDNNESLFALLKMVLDEAKVETQKLATEHRVLHSAVSKVGKAIDKNFVSDYDATSGNVFSEPENTVFINQIICHHFYRRGLFDVAEDLLAESGITMDPKIKELFVRLNYIKESLEKKDTAPALKWAVENRTQLETQMYPPYTLVKRITSASHSFFRVPFHVSQTNFSFDTMRPGPKTFKIQGLELAKKMLQQFYESSDLEYKLHQLEFLSIIKKGVEFQPMALQYAQTQFCRFHKRHEKDIHSMFMLLIEPQEMENSPYSSEFVENLWEDVKELFTRDACALLNLSFDSLLSISINAGCSALPALLNIKHVMKQQNVDSIWKAKDELPIEIDLDPEYRHHSIFACPILRQQSSESNPPMRLTCGHAISKEGLHKLATANKFKCPYCPKVQSLSEVKLIIF